MKYDANKALLESEIPGLKLVNRGKVRDVYDLGDALLFIATDRLSAFDVVLPNGIPGKGRVLTQISLFWFNLLKDVPNHLITADVSSRAELAPYVDDLAGRSMIVKKAKVLPAECIVRGYLVGSGWKDYQKSGIVSGLKLRAGYRQAEKLDEPLFTPSSKAAIGDHDEPISFEQLVDLVGKDYATDDNTDDDLDARIDISLTGGGCNGGLGGNCDGIEFLLDGIDEFLHVLITSFFLFLDFGFLCLLWLNF